MAGQIRTLKLSILGDVDQLKKSLTAGSTEVQGFGNKIGDFSKKAGLAFAAAAAAAGAMALKIGVDAIKAASDLGETISKVNVLFGDTAQDIEKFAESAASSLGQTKQQALDAAATFATFGKSAGLSGKDLGKFSSDFVKLASDLASFNNTSPEQAINAIGSALRGEAEPLRQYGVLLDDASLRQAALKLGIISTTKDALTPQQKVLAAQALIYEQTSAAQGDFERTSDGLANKTRILTAQLENAKTTIGEALLPIVLQLATLFSEKVIPIVQKVANAFGSNGDGMGATLSILANSIKSFVQPIFEGLVGAFNKIKNAVSDNNEELKPFLDLLKNVAEFASKTFAPIFGGAFKLALETIGNIVAGLVTSFSKLVGLITSTINKIKEFVNFVKDNPVSRFFFGGGGASGANFTTGGGFQNIVFNGEDETGGTTVGSRAPVIVTSKQGGTRDISGLSLAQQAAVMRSIELQAETQRLRDARESAAAARESKTTGNTYNINVTGAIDKIGTARTIVDALNSEATSNGTFRNVGSSLLVVS